MFNNQFIAALKCNGKILREKGSEVLLPFNVEYSILLKNLAARAASVKIDIDGQDVLRGRALVIKPKESIEIERFFDQADQGNRFRFIQKTQEISDYRGDRIDDGCVRIEFTFIRDEELQNIAIEHHHHYHWHYRPWVDLYPYPYYEYPVITCDNSTYVPESITYRNSDTFMNTPKAQDIVQSSIHSRCTSMNYCNTPFCATPLVPKEGITVPGSISQQKLPEVKQPTNLEDASYVIIFTLKGYHKGGTVQKPNTVDSKLKCSTCGLSSRSDAMYCSKCGTYLLNALA